jgi:uncharacterized protein (TIRG00374 family)
MQPLIADSERAATQAESAPSLRKKTAFLAVKLSVSGALLAYLLGTTDLSALAERVRTGDLLLLGAAIVLYLAMLAVATWRWRLLLRAQGFDARMGPLSASYLVASFFNNFLPSNIGGDVIRIRDSSRLTGSTTTSVAIIAIDRILGLGALYALALTAYVLGGPDVRRLTGAAPVLVLLGIGFAAVAYIFFKPGTARFLMQTAGLLEIPWAKERFQSVQSAVHVYRDRVRDVWLAFAASVALQSLLIWYYFAVARALKIPLSMGVCFLIVPLCTLVQTIPVSFNGWGVRESLFILYFREVGLHGASALAFSLVGAGLIVLLSLSGAVVWMSRGAAAQG